MTTTQHTPGPWVIEEEDGTILILSVDEAYPIAVIETPVQEDYANANIIADAPRMYDENVRLREINSDLLKVLSGTLKSLRNDIFDWPTYSEDDERLLAWLKEAFTEIETRIKAAIAKAEGDAR